MMNRCLLLLLFFLMPHFAFSAEKKLEKETTIFDETFSWQVMVALSASYNPHMLADIPQKEPRDFLGLGLLIDFYYKGFFIQSNDRRVGGLLKGAELGYQVFDQNDWALDIIAKPHLLGFDPQSIIEDEDKSIPSIEGLSERDVGFGIGLRYSKYYEDAIFSFDIASLQPTNGKGWLAEFFYSHLFLYRNWDIYAGTGLTYYSDAVVDYYLGIHLDEVTANRAYYKAKSGFRAQVEIFARRPISKNWTFNAGITQNYYSSAISDSPIVKKHHLTQVMMGVVYVF
ncbi:MAG: outer membrane protein [Alteromonadaceae bacterium]|jgi:outer membrane protein